MKCPHHDVELVKKEIVYGLPDPDYDFSDVILGGCCIPEYPPRFGYECPVCTRTYTIKDKVLVKFYDEYLDEDEDWEWPEYITKEQAMEIAAKYLEENYPDKKTFRVVDRPCDRYLNHNPFRETKIDPDVYYVSCVNKELVISHSHYAIVSKKSGEVISFACAYDEG